MHMDEGTGSPPAEAVRRQVRDALAEDVGGGDVTAALIAAPDQRARATVISRSAGVFCGGPWIVEVCAQVDAGIVVEWCVDDGDEIAQGTVLFRLSGPARSLLTAERTLLNFTQLLSGTATAARRCARAVAGTNTRILDTRKTVPGLRAAQKYAVAVGGAHNHRMGLFDAFLIKENHIRAPHERGVKRPLGGPSGTSRIGRECDPPGNRVVLRAIAHPDLWVEVEVEDLDELREALAAGPDIVMLDNFTVPELTAAVRANDTATRLEASGGLEPEDLAAVARSGVDYISVGSITKRVEPLDLSMRFD